jgi:2-iminobutanoate/2-iminopropanoate deaminase
MISSKKVIFTTNAPAPIGPYSQAVMTGNMLFVSGQIAIDPQTNAIINADIYQETKQVMLNIGAILEAAGLNYQNIIKTSIFLKDMGNFAAVNEIYGHFFSDNFPARETVEVSRLPKDVNVEISVIAVI